jgi:hypothetical protein
MKCSCVYATTENTESVRKGYEMGGYLKEQCETCKAKDAQDERGACIHADEPKACYRVRCQLGNRCVDDDMSPRAASSLNVATLFEQFFDIAWKRGDCIESEKPAMRRAWDAATSANVAQGAEAVLPAWFDQFLTNVCEIPDRNSPDDEPEAVTATLEELRDCALNAIEQCISYAAPPAQTALTDDVRDAARYRWLRDQNKRMHYTTDYQPEGCTDLIQIELTVVGEPVFTPEGHFDFARELDRAIDTALTAAQSASGVMYQASTKYKVESADEEVGKSWGDYPQCEGL